MAFCRLSTVDCQAVCRLELSCALPRSFFPASVWKVDTYIQLDYYSQDPTVEWASAINLPCGKETRREDRESLHMWHDSPYT